MRIPSPPFPHTAVLISEIEKEKQFFNLLLFKLIVSRNVYMGMANDGLCCDCDCDGDGDGVFSTHHQC